MERSHSERATRIRTSPIRSVDSRFHRNPQYTSSAIPAGRKDSNVGELLLVLGDSEERRVHDPRQELRRIGLGRWRRSTDEPHAVGFHGDDLESAQGAGHRRAGAQLVEAQDLVGLGEQRIDDDVQALDPPGARPDVGDRDRKFRQVLTLTAKGGGRRQPSTVLVDSLDVTEDERPEGQERTLDQHLDAEVDRDVPVAEVRTPHRLDPQDAEAEVAGVRGRVRRLGADAQPDGAELVLLPARSDRGGQQVERGHRAGARTLERDRDRHQLRIDPKLEPDELLQRGRDLSGVPREMQLKRPRRAADAADLLGVGDRHECEQRPRLPRPPQLARGVQELHRYRPAALLERGGRVLARTQLRTGERRDGGLDLVVGRAHDQPRIPGSRVPVAERSAAHFRPPDRAARFQRMSLWTARPSPGGAITGSDRADSRLVSSRPASPPQPSPCGGPMRQPPGASAAPSGPAGPRTAK
ncbi:hypothetical protein [Nannocystis pusilla]|uniref:hypothetical protein n=1 Tax=Nannocystis pusilla TaxID=889268 RepID=UPI003DA40638